MVILVEVGGDNEDRRHTAGIIVALEVEGDGVRAADAHRGRSEEGPKPARSQGFHAAPFPASGQAKDLEGGAAAWRLQEIIPSRDFLPSLIAAVPDELGAI